MSGNNYNKKGFGLIEVVVAVSIFLVIAVTGATTIVGTYSVNRLGDEETEATVIAQEGIEAVRSIRTQGWDDPFLATDCSSGCGLDTSSGAWDFSGSSDTTDAGGGRDFTRQILVEDVYRDGDGDIVASGGTRDPETKRITSTVTWNFTEARSNTVSVQTYLSAHTKSWEDPGQEGGGIDLSGTNNGWKVHSEGDYAYIARNGGSPDFIILNISDPENPTTEATLSLSGNPRNIHVVGDYAYVASTSNSQEVIVIDISDPSSPSVTDSFNASGSPNMFGIYASEDGNTIYATRDSSSSNTEFYTIDATNKNNLVYLDSSEVGSDVNEVYASGNYAYIATDAGNELQVVDISDPSDVFITETFGLTGGNNGETVIGFDDTIVIGRSGANGYVHVVDASDPESLSLLGTFSAGDDVWDVSLARDNDFVFVGGDLNAGEFIVIDIRNPSSPVEIGRVDFTDDINGVYYNAKHDRAITVTDSNSEEIAIFKPR